MSIDKLGPRAAQQLTMEQLRCTRPAQALYNVLMMPRLRQADRVALEDMLIACQTDEIGIELNSKPGDNYVMKYYYSGKATDDYNPIFIFMLNVASLPQYESTINWDAIAEIYS